MKRTIVTLALVTAFVFAFSAVAQATFRGFTPIRTQAEVDDGMLQGFITFPEARLEMQRNFGVGGAFEGRPGANLQSTAHGGYVTSTTLCAVCHSAHRAGPASPRAAILDTDGVTVITPGWDGPAEGDVAGSSSGDINLANVRNQYFLTAGGGTCEACHVNTGAQASRLLVEWGPNGGGPHAAPTRGCLLCHNAGIHGLTGSSFNVMNVFMLGNTRSQGLAGSAGVPSETRDEQIRREINEGRVLRGGTLDIPTDSSFTRAPAATGVVANGAGSTWWYDGARGLGPIGGLPTGFAGAPNGNQFGAARSLATAYTCGEAGCHDATAMFNLNWGMGFERVNYVRGTVPVPGPGGDNVPAIADGVVDVTGHIMPSLRATGSGAAGGGAGLACGPCHGGNPAGFPTASTYEGVFDPSRRAWGCDQCHDMVGVATNSTAWPHGNRNILVYEWDADGDQHENMAAAGNLWMYGGNIARAAGAGIPTTQGNITTVVGGGAVFQGPNSNNVTFADQSWTVLTGVTAGRYGIPGQSADMPAALLPAGTGLTDGSCLKCHVALDSASLDAMDAVGADALRHAWQMGMDDTGAVVTGNTGLGATNPTWNGTLVSGAQRLFLYR